MTPASPFQIDLVCARFEAREWDASFVARGMPIFVASCKACCRAPDICNSYSVGDARFVARGMPILVEGTLWKASCKA
eukprot:5626117-Prymnesium_polylepis.1